MDEGESLMQNLPEAYVYGMTIVDENFNSIFVDENFYVYLYLKERKRIDAFIEPEDRNLYIKSISMAKKDGRSTVFLRMKRSDGVWRRVLLEIEFTKQSYYEISLYDVDNLLATHKTGKDETKELVLQVDAKKASLHFRDQDTDHFTGLYTKLGGLDYARNIIEEKKESSIAFAIDRKSVV